MAQINITTLQDGARNAVFHVAIVGDGLGDLDGEVIIDPANSFAQPLAAQPGITVEALWYDLTGFDAWVDFDHLLTDSPVWTLSGGQTATLDCSVFAGIADRSAADGTGKLKLSTSGLSSGDRGTIIVKVRKD